MAIHAGFGELGNSLKILVALMAQFCVGENGLGSLAETHTASKFDGNILLLDYLKKGLRVAFCIIHRIVRVTSFS